MLFLPDVLPVGAAAAPVPGPRWRAEPLPAGPSPGLGLRPREPCRASGRFVLSVRNGAVSPQKALRSARVFFSRFDAESIGETSALLCTACLILFSVYSQCFKLESKTSCASVLKRGSFKQGMILQLYTCSNSALSTLV